MVLFLRLTVLVAVLLVTCDGFLTLQNQRWSRSSTLQASKEPNIIDNILNTPTNIQKSLKETQKNIQETTDNILQTPDRIKKRVNNAVATVEATKTKIEKTVAIPVSFFQKVVNLIDGKGDDDEEELVPTKYPSSEKSSIDIFEEVKESAYATYDTLVAVTEGVKATAETLKKLPAEINDVQIKAAVTAENIQKDIGKAQQQAEVAGKVFVKIVTGEAAQETIDSAIDSYTKTKLVTEKTIESVQAFVKDPISVVKGPPPPAPTPPPPPPPKKTEVEIKVTETVSLMKDNLETVKGSLETVKESLEIVKENLETVKAVTAVASKVTMTTATTLSKGAMGLKERFAKNLEAQGLANPSSTNKDPTKPRPVVPAPIPIVASPTTSKYFSGNYQQHILSLYPMMNTLVFLLLLLFLLCLLFIYT